MRRGLPIAVRRDTLNRVGRAVRVPSGNVKAGFETEGSLSKARVAVVVNPEGKTLQSSLAVQPLVGRGSGTQEPTHRVSIP